MIEEVTVSRLISAAEKVSRFDFIRLLSRISSGNQNYFFWNKEDESLTILGVGESYSVKISGSERTQRTEEAIEELRNNISSNKDALPNKRFPLFLGGMKFAPNGYGNTWKDFADSEWFIPKYLFFKQGTDYYYIYYSFGELSDETLNAEKEKGLKLLSNIDKENIKGNNVTIRNSNIESPDEKENWFSLVNKALEFIEKENFKKIVLSREINIELSDEPSVPNLMQTLIKRYPHCYVFAFRKSKSVFFGASPEKLAKFKDGWIEADALAGSIPRGETKEEDILLENELLRSKKNLNEQRTVVEFITSSFKKFSDKLEYSQTPVIRKLPNIQHLWTPVRAKIDRNKPLFSILKEVHPTPAICGAPWTTAMDSILKMERHNRGLYTGAVGWFNLFNEGEFAVAIRSALLKQKRLSAYAGCGIVKGSIPETEFEETKLKLKPILNLFKNEN